MTFATICSHLADRMRPDNDSKYAIPSRDVASWIPTTFGSEIARLINEFIVEIHALYAVRSAVTLNTGDQEYNLLDTAICPDQIFLPIEIYIDDSLLKKYDSLKSAINNESYDNGAPWAWVESGEGLIRFNCPVDDDAVTCVASGFCEHPAITADTDVIKTFSSRVLGLFCSYAESAMRESVAADGVGLDRLARFDQKAYQATLRLRGANMTRWAQGDLRA